MDAGDLGDFIRGHYTTREFTGAQDRMIVAVVPGLPGQSTHVCLLHQIRRAGGQWRFVDATKTKTPIVVQRFEVLGMLRLDANANHGEQARYIRERMNIIRHPKVSATLDLSFIGDASAQTFKALKPDYFRAKDQKDDHLRSLLIHVMNHDPQSLFVANGLDVNIDFASIDTVSDARAIGLALHACNRFASVQELRV